MGALEEELQDTIQDVLGKLKSHQLFQSSWDTAAFAVFLVFVGECPPPPPAPSPGVV